MTNLVLSCLESRVEKNRSLYGRFLLAPFQSGDALTVGTALRRALLSQTQGVSITALDIQGITHEYCTVVGVRESVLELSLNFQRVVLRSRVDFTKPQVGYLQVQGPATVYANNLKLPRGIECVDPTQYIATLSQDGLLVIKFLIDSRIKKRDLYRNKNNITATKIRNAKKILQQPLVQEREPQKTASSRSQTTGLAGASDAQHEVLLSSTNHNTNSISKASAGAQAKALALTQFNLAEKCKSFQSSACLQNIIPLESITCPVNRANFIIQADDISNQARERVLFEVWTNGSIHPRQAIHSAALSLVSLFSQFRSCMHLDSPSLGITSRNSTGMYQTEISKRASFLYKSHLDKISLLSSDLSNLSLSLKTYTLLKQKGIHRLDMLCSCSPNTLLDLLNGNKNMFYEIKRCVYALGLQLNHTLSNSQVTK